MIQIRKHPSHDDDQRYWESCRAGDHTAFSCLFEKYYQPLYCFAWRFTRDAQNAENIVQNVFVDLWIKRAEIEIMRSLRSYLFSMTRNQSLNYLKQQGKTESLKVEKNLTEKTVDSPEDIYVTKEFHLEVWRAIENLPDQCRQVYLMKRYDHLKYDEIGQILGISVNTVKTHLKRALAKLSEQLRPFIKDR